MHPPHDNSPTSFDLTPRTRLIYGVGSVDRVGTVAAEWGAKHVLLVTDRHIVTAGHAPRAQRSLEQAGIEVRVFDSVRENPTSEDVDNCVASAAGFNPDTLVGIGGGSSIDTAKGFNFLHTNGGRMTDYRGYGKATKPMLPLIAIPTTAGTGSECQSYALIADAKSHMKMACGDPKAAARVAILDPALTVTQPRLVTADTGIDALTHAVETAVTTRRNPLSLIYSREAFRFIVHHFPTVLRQPNDLEARGRMMLAAAFAGTAIENSMLGAAHAAANPLTAHFGVIHGQAVGLMLPAVIRFNAQDPDARRLYNSLAVSARLISPDTDEQDAVEALLRCVETQLNLAGIPRSLEKTGITPDAIPTLAAEAAEQWTGKFNPRPLTPADFASLYKSLLTSPT